MCSVNSSRVCGGVTFAVVAIALAAITAIALAIIFAPPFLAAYAAIAIYVSVGCGIGAAIATIAAAILLTNKSNNSHSNSTVAIVFNASTISYLAKADANLGVLRNGQHYSECVITVINGIERLKKFDQFDQIKEKYNNALAQFDLAKDPNADNALALLSDLTDIAIDLHNKSTVLDSST